MQLNIGFQNITDDKLQAFTGLVHSVQQFVQEDQFGRFVSA